MVCEVGIMYIIMLYTNYVLYRCMAKDTDFKAEDAGFHHQESSEALVEEFSIAKLWDEWGLVGDVIVNLITFILLQY